MAAGKTEPKARKENAGTLLTLTGAEHEFLADLVLAYSVGTCPVDCEGVTLKDVPAHVQQAHTVSHTLFYKLGCLSFADERKAEDTLSRMAGGYHHDKRPKNDFR